MISKRTKIVYYIPSFGENLRPSSIASFGWDSLWPVWCRWWAKQQSGEFRSRDVPSQSGKTNSIEANLSASTITARVWGCLFFLNKSWCLHKNTKIFKKTRVGDFVNFVDFFNLGRENPPHSKRDLSPHVGHLWLGEDDLHIRPCLVGGKRSDDGKLLRQVEVWLGWDFGGE